MTLTNEDLSLIAFLEGGRYFNFKVVQGKLCANYDYLTTRGIVVGLTEISYGHRYCYQNFEEATTALLNWESEDFAPGNWIKLKGHKDGKALDLFNPNWKP